MSKPFNRFQSSFHKCMLVVLFFSISTIAISQQGFNISGEIVCINNGQVVAFANVALFDTAVTRIVSGAASNEAGQFSMANVSPGTYSIQVSAVGYESYRREIEIHNENLSLGVIGISGKNLELNDVNVITRRIPAKQASGSTTFFINPKMQEASDTGTDILRLLPGVSIDLQNNLSYEGSQNIIILVDGKERDADYLNQLPASAVDKVELISSPSARYEAGVTGVINVVLSQRKESGWEGHVYAEIPASTSEVFLTPSFSLNYGSGKFNLFTSYNGDLRRFGIKQASLTQVFDMPEINTITSTQYLTQKTWSHKFHYGIDWYINDRNQLNLYGFYNPFSQELDGTAAAEATGTSGSSWLATRNDNDINHSLFTSLWYRHIFNKSQGHELTLEASHHNLNAINSTTLSGAAPIFHKETRMEPDNQSLHVKLDYILPVGESINVNSGVQSRIRKLNDKNSEAFRYREEVYSAYGMFSYGNSKLETTVGLRLEYSSQRLLSENSSGSWYLLPGASFKYNLGKAQNLTLNFRQSITYPGFYQLNPYASAADPFYIAYGNPVLSPEIINQVYLEYSNRFANHFLSARLFYRHSSGAIRNLMSFNQEGFFEIQPLNLGDIYHTGIQINGAFGFGKAGINPFLKLFNASSIPGELAKEYQVDKRHGLALESGISAYAALPWNLTASASFHYTSPVNNIQEESFSDALYFLSLEKSFSGNLKAGIVSGIPFAKWFTYQGNELTNSDFSHYSSGNLNLSAVPLWIKISYQFSSGNKRQKIERPRSVPEPEIRKGF